MLKLTVLAVIFLVLHSCLAIPCINPTGTRIIIISNTEPPKTVATTRFAAAAVTAPVNRGPLVASKTTPAGKPAPNNVPTKPSVTNNMAVRAAPTATTPCILPPSNNPTVRAVPTTAKSGQAPAVKAAPTTAKSGQAAAAPTYPR